MIHSLVFLLSLDVLVGSTAVIIDDALQCEQRSSTGVIISAAIRTWIRVVCFPSPFMYM